MEELTDLRSVATTAGKTTQDIEKRMAGAIRAFGLLRRRLLIRSEISLRVKTMIFNAIVLPVLL